MHQIETTHEILFDRRNKPLEDRYARSSDGKWAIYLLSEYLRYRNWKAIEKIAKVYLSPCDAVWYKEKTRYGYLYEPATLPIVDEKRSQGQWLALLIAARRTGLPLRVYAKKGSWQYWKQYDMRQATAGLRKSRGHQKGACDSPGDTGTAVASVESPGLKGRPSDSGSSTSQTVERCPGQREHQAALATGTASAEGWGTRGSATHESGMPLSRTPQED